MTQIKQGIRSTKAKPAMVETRAHAPQQTSATTNGVHIYKTTTSKLYTDDCGSFPIKSRIGKNYIIIAYHFDTNTILQASFATRSEQNRISAYNSIMKGLTNKVHKVDIQILDNEASAEYNIFISEKWQAQYQLVSPNLHRRIAAERAICMFKSYFLSILAGMDP